ncbi:MAG: Flp family type IVb pilin [Acidobacteriota bacterium]|nr:Flp family type IVb pilin [Acidobacteriota bacterium]
MRTCAAITDNSLLGFLRRLLHEDAGQDLVEYALVALAMGLSTVAGVHGLATAIADDFNIIIVGFNSAII